MTICTQCRHLKMRDTRDAWYNYHCGAIELPLAVNPVNGKRQHYRQNDLGRMYFVEESVTYCRDVNDGECAYFEAK